MNQLYRMLIVLAAIFFPAGIAAAQPLCLPIDSLDSQSELLLFLTKSPGGTTSDFNTYIDQRKPAWFYRSHVALDDNDLRIEFVDHESAIVATINRDDRTMEGSWRKKSGPDSWSKTPFSATFVQDVGAYPDSTRLMYGCLRTWEIRFQDVDETGEASFDTSDFHYLRYADQVRPIRGIFRCSFSGKHIWAACRRFSEIDQPTDTFYP